MACGGGPAAGGRSLVATTSARLRGGVDVAACAATGPGTLAGRYLRRFWQPLYHAPDLLTGQAVPIRILSEDYTLYRGEDGTPHLIAPRCAHRATQLSTGWVEATACAASTTAGNTTPPASASSSPPKTPASPPRSASPAIRPRSTWG